MNIFFAPPRHIHGSHIKLTGQEAIHASKALRRRPGDAITVVDGQGGWYEGTIVGVTKETVDIEISRSENRPQNVPRLVLGLGIIKKRARLEFAVEKAVELGVSSIAMFRSEHTVKEKVRPDRLESVVLSAMKQSMQAWLPEIKLYESLDEVIRHHEDHTLLAAHEKTEARPGVDTDFRKPGNILLLVGPEGGFSDSEISAIREKGGQLISLGRNRLRSETAAIVLLSQFI